jgi:glutathione S-transferase
MKLYDSRRAPNPRRVRWLMAEKSVRDLDVVDVDILQGDHKQAEYLAKFGVSSIPALELDDGSTLTESIAICRYLEAVYPEPNLFGVGAQETAFIEMWSRRAEMLLATPLMMTVRHTHPALAALEAQNPSVAAMNQAAAERSLKLFEDRLARAPFLGGDRITIADIIAFVGLDFARMVKWSLPEDAPASRKWAEAMRIRPAAAASVAVYESVSAK